MSASIGMPRLPLGTPVFNRKLRSRKSVLVTSPLPGQIGWIEPKSISGVNFASTARKMYYWNSSNNLWQPVLRRPGYLETLRPSVACYPEVGPGAD